MKYIKLILPYLAIGWLVLITSILNAQSLQMSWFDQMKARNIGPAGMSGRVTAVDVVHKQPEIIYAGTASGGLWKSQNGGIDWQPVFDTQRVASIGALAINQRNPSVVWAGTGEGNPRNSQTMGYGIYKSLDAGRSWKCLGLENTRTIHRIIIHPDDPETIYVAATGSAWGDHPERGVYKTTDGGVSWEKILFVNERTGCADLVIDPDNPNKLVAAMWEYRRWPWFFESGGEGSGMYITFDGGKTWEQRTVKHGLPKGELGRIGLAIANSDPQKIYALVEAEKNALYGSEDGGFTWKLINDKTEIGNRPFYYADIFVDPQNENRLYSIHSLVSMSEDGGKSFEVIVPFSQVHPDHHVFWIHPNNPDFIINGNDGGMAISRDRGVSWRFVENLPIAQFYHINIDNLMPYHVYGGMQDNGSWRGPAYTWRYGGIRNGYWEELYFGDGFDVVPDPVFPDRYGYAMSQEGNLGRYDVTTGYSKKLRPVHPDGVFLRFNWNAAIALDPFDDATIYYGSQFVHKSTDRGENWEIISPDLTTNDAEKQQQVKSGGLTYDVTGAENYTTIVAISPSTMEEDVIWVGTDDGNIQVTQNGGDSWTLVSSNIPDVPEGSWVTQVHPSSYDPAEAFAVINNYRQDDWNPYLYHTTDYGQTWTSLVTEEDVWGYCLSFVQDIEVPELMFLGTEFGLYVSVDKGSTWTKWTQGYPTVSTMDMKIHPREHDLVIGTFGRAAYVLDDISPLRAIAKEGNALLKQPLHVFNPQPAILAAYKQASGTRFAADALYAGENRPSGAIISFWLSMQDIIDSTMRDTTSLDTTFTKATKDSVVVIEIFDKDEKCIRTLRHQPVTGLNRIYWELDHAGVRYPSTPKPKKNAPEPGGPLVLPGVYQIKATYGGITDTVSVEVFQDPRLNISPEDQQALQAMQFQFMEDVSLATTAMDQLRESLESIQIVRQQIPMDDSSFQSLKQETKTVEKDIKQLMEKVTGKESLQGIVRDPNTLIAQIYLASGYLFGTREKPSSLQATILSQTQSKIEDYIAEVNDFFKDEWDDYQKTVKKAKLSPFKATYEALLVE